MTIRPSEMRVGVVPSSLAFSAPYSSLVDALSPSWTIPKQTIELRRLQTERLHG